MDKPNLILLTNIEKIYENSEILNHLSVSFTKKYIPKDETKLKKLFSESKFILSIMNGDKQFSRSYIRTYAKVLEKTNFPALFLASKSNIKKYIQLFPITVDFIVKPVTYFKFNLRVSRILEIYKLVEKAHTLKGLEDEINVRNNVLELTRQELIDGSEIIKALDIAMELSRQELLKQKEEISAREQILEITRQDKIDLLSQIKAFDEIMRYSHNEEEDYQKEIEALENLLVYMINKKKEKQKKNKGERQLK